MVAGMLSKVNASLRRKRTTVFRFRQGRPGNVGDARLHITHFHAGPTEGVSHDSGNANEINKGTEMPTRKCKMIDCSKLCLRYIETPLYTTHNLAFMPRIRVSTG
jgi:hypothetical protein